MSSTAAAPLGLAEAAGLLAAGELSSKDLVEAALAAADALQPELNAFRVLRHDAARAEAEEADRRLAAGERAPLLGVPVAVKDDVDLAGETTPFGCAGNFERKDEDAEAVRRLREAGAVVIGKTNTPEIGQWPWTEGRAFGATRNPWNPAYSPGGSSGGSAVAVASGVVPAAMGSDGAGSVRIPAAWTHLVGLKPQRGRISTWPDPEEANGLTCCGPLARQVRDAALLLDVLTGNHPGELHKPPPPSEPFALAAAHPPAPGGRERRLRVALAWKVPFSLVATHPEPEVRSLVTSVAEALSRLGHYVEEAAPRYALAGGSFLPRSTDYVRWWCEKVPDRSLLDPRTRHNAAVGQWMGRLLPLAKALEPAVARRMGAVFRRFDVVLTPTTARPPLPVGAAEGLDDWETDRLMARACPYAWPWNVVGWPAINVPAGLTPTGLPIGAQLAGPACSEGLLLSLAAELEGELRWQERWPPLSARRLAGIAPRASAEPER